jgi:hypothetical protein
MVTVLGREHSAFGVADAPRRGLTAKTPKRQKKRGDWGSLSAAIRSQLRRVSTRAARNARACVRVVNASEWSPRSPRARNGSTRHTGEREDLGVSAASRGLRFQHVHRLMREFPSRQFSARALLRTMTCTRPASFQRRARSACANPNLFLLFWRVGVLVFWRFKSGSRPESARAFQRPVARDRRVSRFHARTPNTGWPATRCSRNSTPKAGPRWGATRDHQPKKLAVFAHAVLFDPP